ncbi:hypothetical protein B1VFA_062 [Rhizobium phage B1VFA]|nr:hypothetical protein B1VFA_062 [Rhizobium phage B1VFA]
MSNMSLKDWRERAVKLGQHERRQKDRRDRIELIMAAATVLSAVATIATVVVGYYQYQAARDALAANDRNRVFEQLVGSIDAACYVLRDKHAQIMINYYVEKTLSSSAKTPAPKSKETAHDLKFREAAQSQYKKFRPIVASALEPLAADFRVKLNKFQVWAKASQEPGLRSFDDFGTTLTLLSFDPQATVTGSLGSGSDFWAEIMTNADTTCRRVTWQLVPWYRDGVELDLPKLDLSFVAVRMLRGDAKE